MASGGTSIEGWERVHLHYFETEELVQIRSRTRKLYIDYERPESVQIIAGIVPDKQFVSGGKCVSGIFDHEHEMVPTSIKLGGGARKLDARPDATTLANAACDSRTAYYLGHASAHFGHFLLETLPRAWAWRLTGPDVVPVMQSSPTSPQFVTSILALLPGLAERVEFIRRITQFKVVHVPAPAFVVRKKAHVEFKSLCNSLAEQALPPRRSRTERPLYLSRRGLRRHANRALVGEERLEQLLESHGFLVVRPETLSITEQIALFNTHRWIVSPMGSACHARIFSREPNDLLMLARCDFSPNFLLCDALCYGDAHYANVLSTPISQSGAFSAWEPVLLKEQEILSLLKQLGLVRSNAGFSGRSPDQETYRETWYAAARREAERSKRVQLRHPTE